jgi:hypothetical protein
LSYSSILDIPCPMMVVRPSLGPPLGTYPTGWR